MKEPTGALMPAETDAAPIEILRAARGEPLPVIRDVLAMAQRLNAEWRLAASGKHSCCLVVCRPDPVDRFAERDCRFGYLGPNFSTPDLMPLMLANAMRFRKFGA